MYKTESGLTAYETFDELLNAEINDFYAHDDYYYVHLKPEGFYDGRVYKVNKQTEKMSVIHYINTWEIPDEDKIPIDVETFKKERTG